MNGQKLLNNTLRLNAVFSLLSGIDLILFDRTLLSILSGEQLVSLAPTGLMLIGFATFVFIVSILKKVNKYLVGAIILLDTIWVLGSIFLIMVGANMLTSVGIILISAIAFIIAIFASLQTLGLKKHLNNQVA